MSDAKKLPRPPQVSLAGWVTIAGSVFVVVNAFEVIGNLRSIDTRERVQEALSQEPLKGTGMGLQQALDVMHGAALVVGACAAAAAILGWFVMQQQKSARLALSIVAVPLFVGGLIAGGFLTSMVAVCAAVLWTRPSRDWFNGQAPPKPEERRTPPASNPWGHGPSGESPSHRAPSHQGPDHQGPNHQGPNHQGPNHQGPNHQGPNHQAPNQGPESASGSQSGDQPRPFSGFGSHAATGQLPDPDPYAANPWATATPAERRPRDVTRACVVTWVTSGLIGLGWLLIAVWGAVDATLVNDMFEQEPRFRESGLSIGEVRAALIVTSVLLAIWSALAAGVAVFVHRGYDWARILLIISAVGAGFLALLMVIAAPPMILVPVAAGYTIYALTRPASNDWFRALGQQRRSR